MKSIYLLYILGFCFHRKQLKCVRLYTAGILMAAFSLSHIQHVHSEGKYKLISWFAFESILLTLIPVSSMYLLLNRHLYFQLNFLTFSRKTEHIILYQAKVAVEALTEHRSKICIAPSSSSQGMGNLKKEYLVLY